jgi:hypothetical protein
MTKRCRVLGSSAMRSICCCSFGAGPRFEINSLGTQALYNSELAAYREDRNAWAERYATAAGNDIIKGFYYAHWLLIKAQFEGDAPGVGLAGGIGALGGALSDTERLTYLYQKVGSTGEHLKFGVTVNPLTRYSQEQLAGGQLRILTSGTRQDMLQLERNLHETLPIGPEERQSFYIQKQIELGLTPPPHKK